MLNCLRKWMIL